MKKLLLYIASILFIIIAFDFLVGVCCKYYIKNHQLTGRYEPLDRLLKTVNSDILIIGNSIILNSLDPKTIEDSLSQSCYNGGIIGQGIDFSETIIDCVLQRYTPKTIILGLRPEEMGGNIGDGIYDILRQAAASGRGENAGAGPGFWEVPRGLCGTSHAQIGIGVNGLSSTSHSVPPKEEPTDSGLFLKAPYQITVKRNEIINRKTRDESSKSSQISGPSPLVWS